MASEEVEKHFQTVLEKALGDAHDYSEACRSLRTAMKLNAGATVMDAIIQYNSVRKGHPELFKVMTKLIDGAMAEAEAAKGN